MIDQVIDKKALSNWESDRDFFAAALPFRHVKLDNFLTGEFLENILAEFPELPTADKLVSPLGQPSRKHAVHNILSLGPAFVKWDAVLRSGDFIRYLEGVTGIDGLIHDPEYHGAGTHNNLDGQGMLTHIDFNFHRTTGYHRRLNLIVYLNDDWGDNWGGHIELHKDPWSVDEDWFVSYPPMKNLAVLFETNEHSWHGFDVIRLPSDKADENRKSLTVYYYTQERPADEIGPRHSSIFAPRMLPANVEPDEDLSTENHQQLLEQMRRNARHIKGIYITNSKQMVRIDGLEHQLGHYREHLTIKSAGPALQVGAATGLYPDGRIVDELTVSYKILEAVSAVTFHLYLSQPIGANSIQVDINGTHFEFPVADVGHSQLECEYLAVVDQPMRIRLACSWMYSSEEVDSSADSLEGGAILESIRFQADKNVITTANEGALVSKRGRWWPFGD